MQIQVMHRQILSKVSWTHLGIPSPSIHLCLWQSQQSTFVGASQSDLFGIICLVLQQHQGLTNLCQRMNEYLSWAERVCLYRGQWWGEEIQENPPVSQHSVFSLSTYSSCQNTRKAEETGDFSLDKQLKCKPVGEWICVPLRIADHHVVKHLINLYASLKLYI